MDGAGLKTFALDEGAAAVGKAVARGASAEPGFVLITDASLRYVHVDGAVEEWIGAPRQYLLGASARDFFATPTFQRHEALDRRVMRNGTPLMSQLDLAMRANGTSQWANVSRWRVAASGAYYVAVKGVLITSPVRPSLVALTEAMREPIYDETPVHVLAARAGASVAQLEEDAMAEFEFGLARLVTKLRLERTIELASAGSSLTEAAKTCGYATLTAFSRRFSAVSGMAPNTFIRLRSPAIESAAQPTSSSTRPAPSLAYRSR